MYKRHTCLRNGNKNVYNFDAKLGLPTFSVKIQILLGTQNKYK